MKTNHIRNREGQRGAISIFTVIMFAILMSIIAVGFVRLTLDEQEQTLQDDLSKSAYNAAQAGIEEAKRAMLKCESIPETPLTQLAHDNCEKQLYNPNCPGFNAVPNPAGAINLFGNIGIPRSYNSRTPIGDEATAATPEETAEKTAEGYSCVVVTPDTKDLAGALEVDTPNDSVMYELKTVAPFSSLKLEWHNTKDVLDLKTSALLGANGNPRKFDAGQWGKAPAALRLTLVKTPAAGIDTSTSAGTVMNSNFLYPVSNGVAPPVIPFLGLTDRHFARCTNPDPSIGKDYACTAIISVPPSATDKYYIVLKPLYADTRYKITALDGVGVGNVVKFKEVEPSIDSTGYTSGVYRRVQARVQVGSDILPLSSALEAGDGVCKDFVVGATLFTDNCSY